MQQLLALLSGGLDSTVLVAHLLSEGHDVRALSALYGQRHGACELGAAAAVARFYDIEHRVVDLRPVGALLTGSALASEAVAVPDGHYAAESMRVTVVPNRNMIFLAVAGGMATALGLDGIAIAVHGGDHCIYPDCRPGFVDAMRAALAAAPADMGDIALWAPFVTKTKAELVTLGRKLDAPLALSWSCYKGNDDMHCGTCGSLLRTTRGVCSGRRSRPNRISGFDNSLFLAGAFMNSGPVQLGLVDLLDELPGPTLSELQDPGLHPDVQFFVSNFLTGYLRYAPGRINELVSAYALTHSSSMAAAATRRRPRQPATRSVYSPQRLTMPSTPCSRID